MRTSVNSVVNRYDRELVKITSTTRELWNNLFQCSDNQWGRGKIKDWVGHLSNRGTVGLIVYCILLLSGDEKKSSFITGVIDYLVQAEHGQSPKHDGLCRVPLRLNEGAFSKAYRNCRSRPCMFRYLSVIEAYLPLGVLLTNPLIARYLIVNGLCSLCELTVGVRRVP